MLNYSKYPVLRAWCICAALFMIMMTGIAPQASFAQDNFDDPEDRFFTLLEDGNTLDDARDIVADEFDDAVAADVAVYLCSPIADDNCPGSLVFSAWEAFLDGIDEGSTVGEVVDDMLASYDDAYLVYAIAVYWCSPDAEEGCGSDQFTEAWADFYTFTESNPNPADAISRIYDDIDPLIAELIAASACGESTCYADELAEFDDEQFELLGQPERESQVKPERPGTDVQLANKLGSPKQGWMERLKCAIRGC